MNTQHKEKNGDSVKLLLIIFLMLTIGGFIGCLFRLPHFEQAYPYALLLSGALGTVYLWALTCLVPLLVAASVWCAMSNNRDSVGTALLALLFFAFTTAAALGWGATYAVLLGPGLQLELIPAVTNAACPTTLSNFLNLLLVKGDDFLRLENRYLLQIIICTACAASICMRFLPKTAEGLSQFFTKLQRFCLAWMKGVLRILPVAVFFMAMNLLAKHGVSLLATQAWKIVAADLLAMTSHICSIFGLLGLLVGPQIISYVQVMSQAYITAFATRSSLATLPTTLRCAEKAGIPSGIAEFIFPFGATVNMDGTCAHLMVALIVILQSLGHPVSLGLIISMALTVMLASVATAAAPSASISLLRAITVSVFAAQNIAVSNEVLTAALTLFAALDVFSDALRTLTNLVGDSMAALFIHKFSSQSAKTLPLSKWGVVKSSWCVSKAIAPDGPRSHK
ncbi:MAG: dicarboxylate/amino acid:cation symporter [Xenococcaceae cyanobacterium]